jgi:hypothetical protein
MREHRSGIREKQGYRSNAAGMMLRRSKGVEHGNVCSSADRRFIAVLLVMAGVAAVSPRLAAEESATFSWGFQERIRQEYLMNGFDMENDVDDDRNHIRVRTQVWFSYRPHERFELFAKINNEHRHYLKPERDLDFDEFIDEFIFENLYLKATNIAGSPVSIILGRQNIMYGEGFLYMDGGPLDGSRTAYMNAVRIMIEGKERSLEIHALSDPARDEYLPRVNSRRKALVEWDEAGGGIYYTDTSLPETKAEGYYFFKWEEAGYDGVCDTKLHTIGARLSGAPLDWLSYAAEGAYQAGTRADFDNRAFGGYLYGTVAVPLPLEPKVTVGAIYLSGDDPATEEYEGWDPLISRWPKWSDLYIYTLATEHGAAYWDNLVAPYAQLSLKLASGVDLSGTIYDVTAPHSPPPGSPPPSMYPLLGNGTDRGVLSNVKIDWSWTKYLRGHLLWERFDPGDYYIEGSDPAHFLRWEINVIY